MSDRTWQDVFEQYLQVFHPMMYHYTLAVCWLIFHSVFKLNSQWTTAESVDVRKCEPPVGRFKNHRYWWNSKHGRLLTKILAQKILIIINFLIIFFTVSLMKLRFISYLL